MAGYNTVNGRTPPTRVRSRNYRLSRAIGALPAWAGGLGVTYGAFTIDTVDLMLCDDQVSNCILYRDAPVKSAEFEITADDPRVKDYVEKTLRTHWQRALQYALKCEPFGRSSSEVLWREEDGLTWYDGLLYIGARDCMPYTLDGKLHHVEIISGLRDGVGNLALPAAGVEGPGSLPKGFHVVNDPASDPWFGRSCMIPVWKPWRQKVMPDGATDDEFRYFYKSAGGGVMVRYPDEDYEEEDGQITHAQELGQQMIEQVKSMAAVLLPSGSDDHGQPKWDINPYTTTAQGIGTELMAWTDRLDKRISRALNIPDEILEHDSSTGGYARAKVALLAWLILADGRVDHQFHEFNEQILKPAVAFNFGQKARYEVKPKSLVPPDQPAGGQQEQPGQPGQEQGQPGGGGLAALLGGDKGGEPQAGAPQQPAPGAAQTAPQGQQGGGMQLSADPVRLSFGPHDYASTQFDLPEGLAAKVKALAAAVKDEHLAGDGREQDCHITAKFGLHQDDPAAVAALVSDFGLVRATLGKTSLFESPEHDVLKIDVDSPDLHRLHALLGSALANTETYPEYVPHATVAYLAPGKGKQYIGDDALEGVQVTFDTLTFSDRAGNRHAIPLTASVAAVTPETEAEEQPSLSLLRGAVAVRDALHALRASYGPDAAAAVLDAAMAIAADREPALIAATAITADREPALAAALAGSSGSHRGYP